MERQPENRLYRFGSFTVDVARRELRRGDDEVEVQPRVFDLLVYLVQHSDRAVDKDELQDAVWPGMFITETALTRAVMKARKAVGDDASRQRMIKTIHGHGYRFVAELAPAETGESAEPPRPADGSAPAEIPADLPSESRSAVFTERPESHGIAPTLASIEGALELADFGEAAELLFNAVSCLI